MLSVAHAIAAGVVAHRVRAQPCRIREPRSFHPSICPARGSEDHGFHELAAVDGESEGPRFSSCGAPPGTDQEEPAADRAPRGPDRAGGRYLHDRDATA